MRRLKLALTLIVLAGFTHPGWSCPWVPPTDPCLSEDQVEAQCLANWEARQSDETAPEIETEPADVLEADLSLEALPAFQTAISAGDLELFDPIEGFTGIRLRDASSEFQARWRSGQEGVLQVLAAVEANARLRESLEAQNR